MNPSFTNDINKKGPLVFCFLILILCGALNLDKYGVSWDEKAHRFYGVLTWNYMNGRNLVEEMPEKTKKANVFCNEFHNICMNFYEFWHPEKGQHPKVHGAAFELLLFFAEKMSMLTSKRSLFLLRHGIVYLTYLFGCLLIFFFARRLSQSVLAGYVALLFFVLTPRLFAHAFFNVIDIPLLVFFLAAVYSQIRWLEERSPGWALLHGSFAGFCVAIRPVCIVLLAVSALLFAWDTWRGKHKVREWIPMTCIVLVSSVSVTLALWPYLWKSPFYNFYASIFRTAKDLFPGKELYLGNSIFMNTAPWHYLITWISVTIPLIYLLFFLLWCINAIKNLILRPWKTKLPSRIELLCLFYFGLPVLSVIVLRSSLFNGWRHLYFIYPYLLFLSVHSMFLVFRYLQSQKHLFHRLLKTALFVVVALMTLKTAKFMVDSHPLQNTYFNELTGGVEGAKGRFEIGYYGPEYLTALKTILKFDKSKKIRVVGAPCDHPGGPLEYNAYLLDPADADRLEVTGKPQTANYYITNFYQFYFTPKLYDWIKKYEVWNMEVSDESVLSIIRVVDRLNANDLCPESSERF